MTFGIVPHAPETGYGYIRQGKAVSAEAYQVAAFVEKPDLATAETHFASKEYYWNSGMFLFRASRYLEELAAHRPDILAACQQAMQGVHHDLDFLRLNEAAFLACPILSIMRSWKKHKTRWWCRWTHSGAMLVPGRHCGK